jgi:hypothetical protein
MISKYINKKNSVKYSWITAVEPCNLIESKFLSISFYLSQTNHVKHQS